MLPTIRIAGQDYQLSGCPPEDIEEFEEHMRCIEKAHELARTVKRLVEMIWEISVDPSLLNEDSEEFLAPIQEAGILLKYIGEGD